MNRRGLLAVVLACTISALPVLGAQAAVPRGYPNVDQPLAIADGDTVQLLNRILIDRAPGQRGARVDVQYATRIPASDVIARGEQADRVAQIVGAEAWKAGARKVTVSVCDTRACAETREPPRFWFAYERVAGGVWQRSSGK